MNVQVTTGLQQDVKTYLEGITGVYVKIEPIPNKGLMVKTPSNPTVMVNNPWFNNLVDEVIMIFSGQENPDLLVFDDENSPHFFTFGFKFLAVFQILNPVLLQHGVSSIL
ncbi:hypothetical protein [Cytobacillus purgationiresistens]|uniref:Uncharacterized protein n=1 Tax=Cytobacillus purgationiresistens TaxID=863449 RepID=A0ABU0APJ1_9BACI|nr:hypothetical protein [Cytobacillus purgationiresistens]MDQ0273182.1 hypothetical protein [Cytobacillus purgationiresistens]